MTEDRWTTEESWELLVLISGFAQRALSCRNLHWFAVYSMHYQNLREALFELRKREREATALWEHLLMSERLAERWKDIPETTRPQLRSEPDD